MTDFVSRPFSMGLLAIGAILIVGGAQGIRLANEGYEKAIETDNGVTILALAGIGLVAMILGCILMFRSLPKKIRIRNQEEANTNKSLWGMIGLATGVSAVFLFVLGIQAKGDAERAGMVMDETALTRIFIAAGCLAVLGVGYVVLGLMTRNRGFHRAFLFFLISAILMVGVTITHWVVPVRMIDMTGFYL